MELTINEAQTKNLLREIMIELVQEKREWFSAIVIKTTSVQGDHALPVLPNSRIMSSTTACMARRPATRTSLAKPEPSTS